ncbi:helix-turn-helix domain-containing protein [Halobacillus kuroshimensis]|uniref:helix-turn-helix domain-containing protein n=1 Tax=Halobacillus kuroshimensis TaxID=302481 RepID=UPI0004857ECD|nr:helix-turn-helix transcriptional regulator [Halobacillus kuroshimensis]
MIGRNIKRVRKQQGITLSELANRSGISKSYLSNLERDLKQNPSIQIMKNIAGVLRVDIEEIIDPIKGEETKRMNEWGDFVAVASEYGLEQDMLDEYKEVIAFIHWRRQQQRSKNR